MKKIIYPVCIATMISCISNVPEKINAETELNSTYINCDFNSDGLINGDDVNLITDRYMESAIGNDNIISDQVIRDRVDQNADLNGDGKINGQDSTVLCNLIKDNNIYGDVNCDGIVDGKDASCVLGFYARHSSEEYDWKIGSDIGVSVLGDFDKNEVIDARDASAILKNYADSSVMKK
jgi:hypothetical protein